jgi:protein TonB
MVSPVEDIAGEFEVLGTNAIVSITPLYGSFFRTECHGEGWQGVIVSDRGVCIGITRPSAGQNLAPGAGVARQTIDCSDLTRLVVTTSYASMPDRTTRATWKRVVTQASVLPFSATDGTNPDQPPFGQLIDVDELPRVVTQTEPVYPEKARKAKVEGTVIVHAVVRRDGTVGDVRVVRGVPGLDDAAVETVRQWRFKPALKNGAPVATWVATPVRFVLPKK